MGEVLSDASECLLGAVDYLGFRDLAACLACSQRLLCHGVSPLLWDASSWRMTQLENGIPTHARWRPAKEQLTENSPWKHLRAGASTWHFARGLQLYEQKRFEDAEEHLRALLELLPGRPFAMCRLADTLYGRAVSLLTHQRQPEQSSPSSTPPVVDGMDEEDDEEQPMVLLSRSPTSPTHRPLTAVNADGEASLSPDMQEAQDGDAGARPLLPSVPDEPDLPPSLTASESAGTEAQIEVCCNSAAALEQQKLRVQYRTVQEVVPLETEVLESARLQTVRLLSDVHVTSRLSHGVISGLAPRSPRAC